MTRRQFGYLVGFLFVWLAWAAGWLVLAAVAVGLVGYGAVRLLEGAVDFGQWTERFRESLRH